MYRRPWHSVTSHLQGLFNYAAFDACVLMRVTGPADLEARSAHFELIMNSFTGIIVPSGCLQSVQI